MGQYWSTLGWTTGQKPSKTAKITPFWPYNPIGSTFKTAVGSNAVWKHRLGSALCTTVVKVQLNIFNTDLWPLQCLQLSTKGVFHLISPIWSTFKTAVGSNKVRKHSLGCPKCIRVAKVQLNVLNCDPGPLNGLQLSTPWSFKSEKSEVLGFGSKHLEIIY